MEIILIGEENSKRTKFFNKAVTQLGHTMKLLPWGKWTKEDLENGKFIKIDPPSYTESDITSLPMLIDNYSKQLEKLQIIQGAKYLNDPLQLYKTLDKVQCKQILMDNDIPTTPMIRTNIKNLDDLRNMVNENKMHGVFIKPRYGSGAAGILVYQYNPRMKEEIVYTTIALEPEHKLWNTKKMRKLTDESEISMILNLLLKQEVIIERWVPKAKYKGLSYDLRVVYQYGKIDFILARGSKTPVTNLHLNNCAIDIEAIHLSQVIKDEIETLCHRTMKCFEGLNVAGIDVLVTSKGKLMVIEVNGQGDLIYQDLFNDNKIYTSQMIGMINEYE